MIPAHEALQLPTAQLTPAQTTAVETLLVEIEAHVRNKMERRGCDFETKETDGNVLAEVNQRLKAAGYTPQWQPMAQQSRFRQGVVDIVGFKLSLAPNDEAYKTAARASLS